MVSTGSGTLVIPLREIDWIEAADYYARLWVGGRSYLLRESLAHLERRVSGHGFVRAHRQALVRIGSVSALVPTAAGEVAVLTSGAKVPISRRRRASVRGRRQATRLERVRAVAGLGGTLRIVVPILP